MNLRHKELEAKRREANIAQGQLRHGGRYIKKIGQIKRTKK